MSQTGTSGIASSDVVTLFPTFVWRTRVEPAVAQAINDPLLALLERATGGFPTEYGAKVQTEQSLHGAPEMAEVVRLANGAVRGILDFLKVDHQGFAITGCWANIGAEGSPHRMHSHPNNFLSGVYYVRAPEGGNVISFHDPRPQPAIISPPPREVVAANAGKADLRVETGDLVIFPSWLFHSVPANRSKEHRVSIAFNFMFRQFEELMSPPRWDGKVRI